MHQQLCQSSQERTIWAKCGGWGGGARGKAFSTTYRHADAAYAYVGAQALPDAGALPKDAQDAFLLLVEHAGEYVVHVGAGADQEEDDEEEGLEVEEGRLS